MVGSSDGCAQAAAHRHGLEERDVALVEIKVLADFAAASAAGGGCQNGCGDNTTLRPVPSQSVRRQVLRNLMARPARPFHPAFGSLGSATF